MPDMNMGSVMGNAMSAYGQGVKPAGGPQTGPQQTQQLQFKPGQQVPGAAPMMQQPAPQLIQPQAPQPWGINIGTQPQGPMGQEASASGVAAGAASRQTSLQAAINNLNQANSLSTRNTQPAPSQSTQAQGAQRQPQPNLAELSRQIQADTASEQARQQTMGNPNSQWASQQAVNPNQMGAMNETENYVNQNAYTPPNLLNSMKGSYG